MTTVKIAYDAPDSSVKKVESILADAALRDPDWCGAEFIIERDDYTDIAGAQDEAAATSLLHQILRVIEMSARHDTGAIRQARRRAKGRQVSVVLTDPEAIAALDAISAAHGGPTAGITWLLKSRREAPLT